MKWDKQYEIDVPFIDAQHSEWFSRVAKLGQAIDKKESTAEMADALRFVVEYTRKHFADEEAYMREMHYPKLESQQALHKAFEKHIVEVLIDLRRGKDVPPERLYRFMSEWIIQHIQEEDQQIRLAEERMITGDVPDSAAKRAPHDTLAEKLDELTDLLASELITEADVESKKLDLLKQFAADPPAATPVDTIAKLEILKSMIAKGLLAEDDLKNGREQLAQNINLSKELCLHEGFKAKMIHLKNLLDAEIISEDQFEDQKAEILRQM